MEKTESAPAAAPAPTPAPAAAPAPAPAAAPAPAVAPKKKKTGLIITIIIVALALIGGGVAAFFLLRKNPTDVVADAFINTAKTLSEKSGSIEFDGAVKADASGLFSGNLTFNGKASKDGDIEANLAADVIGSKFSADLVVKDSTLYAKIDGIAEITSMLSMFGGSGLLPAGSTSMLSAVEGKWFYVDTTSADLSTMIAVPGIEDIENADINKEEFNDYFTVEAYSGDVVSKKIGDLYKLTFKDASMSTQGVDSIYVEIKDNNLVRVYAVADAQGVSISIDITLTYPDSVKVEAPLGAKSLEELMISGYKTPSYIDFDDDDDDDYDFDYDYDYDDYLDLLDYDDIDDLSAEDLELLMQLLGE